MKNHKSNISMVGGALAIVLLLVAFYYFSKIKENKTSSIPSSIQSPASAYSDWKVYIDRTYNFSIKYPEFLNQRLDKTEVDNSTYRLRFSDDKLAGDNIEINILKNDAKLNSLEYIKTEAFKNEDRGLGWHNDQKPTHKLNLDKLDATQMDIITGGAQGDFGPVVFVAKDNIVIQIVARNLIAEDKDLFNEMLATFEFTK